MLNFLKYTPGSQPGIKRSLFPNKKETNKRQRDKEYEKKRPQRTFNEDWKLGRDWLKFLNGRMTCSVCIDYYGTHKQSEAENIRAVSTFICGSTNLKKSAIVDHETSRTHLKAADVKHAATASVHAIAQSRAGKALQAIKIADRKRVSNLVRNAHAIAKQNRPLTDYTWIAKLDKAKGVEIGNTYINDKAGLAFIECIADSERMIRDEFVHSTQIYGVNRI
jgi:hypothetical protein